jgi:hypothetical protein
VTRFKTVLERRTVVPSYSAAVVGPPEPAMAIDSPNVSAGDVTVRQLLAVTF